MRSILLKWVAWSGATKTRFIWIWGVLSWGGSMITWNIAQIRLGPIEAAFVLVAASLFGGFLYGLAMWHFSQWLRRKNHRKSD